MEEDTEYLKLPIDERCQHKLWKARVNGYEAAAKQFQSLDEKNPEFSKYLGLIKKFVTDSNAVAQEKGLDAVLAYVENAGCAGKTVGEVMSGIVTKCLGAPKAKTKEKGMAIAMMYIEIEKHEIVQEELTKGFSNKTPKIVAACVTALRDALREFGSKVISIKLLVKQIPALLEDRDKSVREEAKLLTVEVYRWTGAAIKPQLSSLKPVQLTELEAEFVKLGGEKPVPTRFLRSQQELRAKMQQQQENGDEDAGAESEEDSSGVREEEDPYVLMEAVNILSQLPADFYEKCEAKKWQERKEAMDVLQALTSNPKLESGDYGDLVRNLKKIISKDANVVVVAVAVKCLGGLAVGLRMKFHPYAGQCVSTILEKFKEKKQAVVQALREASDAIYPTTSLEATQEDILAALDNKNPAVKAETAAFLARCFRTCTPVILNKKLLKVFSTALLKTLNDTDPSVRDNSAEALGSAMKVVSEKNIMPFIQDIGPVKLAKVMECYEKAEIITPKPTGGKTTRTKSAPPKGKVSSSDRDAAELEEEAVIMPRKKPLSAPPGGNKTVNTRPKGVSAKTKKPSISSGTTTTEVQERELSPEEVEEQAEALLPPEVYTGLGDANWKTRLSAIEQFMEFIKGLDKKEVPTQTMVRILAKKPGFKDTNFQVLKLRLEAVLYLASECVFSRRSAQYCILDLADKLGDPKNGALAAETLMAISEATKLEYVSSQVLETVFSQKNPKTHAEALNWLASAIKEFGVKQLQVKSVIEYVKKALASTNPAVRSSAVNLLGVMYLYIGPSLRVFFENEKSALLQQIDAEFEKLQGIPPPAPIRGIHAESKLSDDAVEEEGGAGDGAPPVINIADLIPRTDICGLLTPQLLQELADKNWKVRGEALQRLATIVSEAKFITPNLGDLPPILKARTTDSNRNLAIQALNICQAIGTAMGPNCTKYVRMLAHGMVLALGDNKSMVRAAGLSCLNAWLEQCGLNPFIEGEMLSDALKMENPCLRAELLGWLLTTLPTVKVVSPDLSLCVPHLYSCLEDRNSDVRKKAQDAVLPFMIHLGYDKMVQATGKLKPVSKTAVATALDKAKPSLPAKPAPKNQKRNGGGLPASNRQEDADVAKGKAPNGPKRATSKTRLSTATANKGKRKEEDADFSPSLQFNNLKEQRVLDEQRLKVLKWNFTSPRDEFYEQLKDQMTTAGVNRGLQANMFHNDFKFHIKAIDALIECLESSPEATVANLDLVLKWLALRFFDTNPSVLLKALEYLQQLFLRLSEDHYSLLDYEAVSFVPYLVLKVGDPKDAVRQAVRSLFRLICKVYPASKMFSYIIEGLKSKNARQRTECLEELGYLIESYGINVCQPNPQAALKEVTHQISDRDNSVRNAALNCVVQAYFLEGEKVYRYVGHISDKEMCLLEERIKRSSRNRPPPSAVNRVPPVDAPRTGRPGAKVMMPPTTAEKKDDEQVLTIRRPSSQPPSRPVSGMFSLDLDKIEKMMEENMALEMPNLVEHDLDELKPVCLPATRIRRPTSPVSKLLSHSSDVASAMDLVISQIASNDINTAVHALAQIDEFLKDEDRAEMMQSRVDQLVIAETLQLRMVYSRHMGDDSTNGQDIIKLYRCLTMTLVTLFHNRNLAKRASKSVLRDLVDNLVTILLDERLNRLEEGPHVIRSINVLIVKVVERANLTNILCALIKLLHDSVGNDTSSSKFTELVMKCLWKTLRMLPALMADLNVDRVLLELHLFLKAYPSSHWKERSTDTPLRTVKTLLHALVKHNGNKIMSHLTLIDNLQESEMEAYLQKLLKGGLRHRPSDNQQLDDKPGRRDIKSPRRISKSAHETLAEIFKKIGSKDYTKEGLADLYDFKQLHPDANIDPFLHKSSQFFQNYIERGLRTISQERQGQNTNNVVRTTLSETTFRSASPNSSNNNAMITTNVTTVTTKVSSSVLGGQVDLESASIYKERLKMLRARCGYDNADIRIDPIPVLYDIKPSMLNRGSATPPEPLSSDSKTSTEMIVPMGIPRSESSDAVSNLSKPNMNVDDLRQRLERIKNSTRT